ncbi:MAG: cysteine synthase A [Lentisphaeria bacterium]|nr:cysteine synthase A [Lentisphaeria bacterium]
MNIAKSILETIGNTPLVDLSALLPAGCTAQLVAKVESFNPGGSAKDRVGIAMIEAAEKAGTLAPGGMIIEPTSGNTGVGLAIAAAVKGYRLILTMPDTMSVERQRLLAAFGAELVLTPGNEGIPGAIAKAQELHAANPGSLIMQQFNNPANPEAHRRTTALELLRDTDNDIACFVAGVGTGGTLTGCADVLKKVLPQIHIAAVEPDCSAVISGKKPGPHQLQGIGAGFIPAVLNVDLIDEVVPVSAADAGDAARNAARKTGVLIGISGGAALHAAIQIAQRPIFQNKRIVVLLPDTGERYLSTWLFEK